MHSNQLKIQTLSRNPQENDNYTIANVHKINSVCKIFKQQVINPKCKIQTFNEHNLYKMQSNFKYSQSNQVLDKTAT